MNEIQTNKFDYSLLSSDEKLATLENEKRLVEIFESYEPEVGRVLFKQQEVMSSHGNGTFQKWYESQGFNRGKVYQYINKYKFLNNIEELAHKDIFSNAPKSLQNEMSKPSADPEINQKVFDGDIKNHKDYKDEERKRKEAERKAKEYEQQLESAHQENDILQNKVEDLENQEPKVEVQEKYYEPDDYQDMKKFVNDMESITKDQEKHIGELEQEIADMRAKRSDMDKKSREYDQLNSEINEMNQKLTDGQLRLKNQKMAYDLIKDAKQLVSEVAPLVYSIEWLDLEDNEYARKPLKEIAENLNDVSQKIMQKLDEKQIIEVN